MQRKILRLELETKIDERGLAEVLDTLADVVDKRSLVGTQKEKAHLQKITRLLEQATEVASLL